MRRTPLFLIGALIGMLWVSPAAGQTDKQLWGDVTLEWIESHSLTLKVDVEPKALVSKPPDKPG